MAEKVKNMINKKGKDRISNFLYCLYIVFLLTGAVVLVRIAYIQLFYKPDPLIAGRVLPKSIKKTLEPERGSIFAQDGRLLAMSVPMYQIYMDCTVQKEALGHKENGEEQWREKAKELSAGLSSIYRDRSATDYYNLIISGRNSGKKYQKIGAKINHDTLQLVKNLPLFREGQNRGGIIVEKYDTRQYPYGSLARRVIGYVKDNKSQVSNNKVGIEGNFDTQLHGEEGYEWMRETDGGAFIHNYDSSYVKAVDGLDVKTTLDIDLQDIADRALRNNITDNMKIEGGCVIVMDVQTGAVKAMVNLVRDNKGRLGENYNYAIGRKGEPGSIFKTVLMMSLLEDGKIHLSDKIPTNHGKNPGFSPDAHIYDYERQNRTDSISILHGFEISSNYVFQKLAMDYYGKNPKVYMDKIHSYHLGEKYDFDLVGMVAPTLPPSDVKKWSKTDIGSVGIGYTIAETPLHMLTFYNSIANKGRMMKPYLVESIERNGRVVEKRGPSVLNPSVCSRATVDSLTVALRRVVSDGTGRTRLKGAKCEIAGKTGTARIVIDPKYGSKSRDPYQDEYGRRQYQATFVGFFPVEQPKYSAICVVYSTLDREVQFGGTIPAMTIREIVDKTFAINPANGNIIKEKQPLPKWDKENIQ